MGRLRFVLLFQGHLRYYTQKNWYLYYIIYIYMHIFGHLQFVVRFFVFIWLKNTVSSSYHIIILSCGIIHFNVVVRLETSQDALAYPHGLAGEHPTIRPTISWFEWVPTWWILTINYINYPLIYGKSVPKWWRLTPYFNLCNVLFSQWGNLGAAGRHRWHREMHGRPLIKAAPANWNRTRCFLGGTSGKCGKKLMENVEHLWSINIGLV